MSGVPSEMLALALRNLHSNYAAGFETMTFVILVQS